MKAYWQRIIDELESTVRKPMDKNVIPLLQEIEKRPALFIGNDVNIRCLFHFLNGWQMGAAKKMRDGEICLDEKMNAFLALKYGDFDSLNWEGLLIKHEGEAAAFGKFFEYLHEMENG